MMPVKVEVDFPLRGVKIDISYILFLSRDSIANKR